MITHYPTDNSKLDEERGFQADNVGPFQVGTINGCKYVGIFVDKKESYTYYELNNNETGFPAKFIRNALEHFLSYGIVFDKGGVDSRFATDGAKSIMNIYYSQQFGKPTKGIKLQVAAAPGSERLQLGVAERKSQTVARERAAATLRAQTDSSSKPNSWGCAMTNAIDVISLTPTKRDSYKKAPHAKATGQEIDLHKTLLPPFRENVKCVICKEGGERVGVFYNPASKLTTLRRRDDHARSLAILATPKAK